MTHESAIEITRVGSIEGLAKRVLNGEVFVLRGGLQQIGLMDGIVESTLAGIRKAAGQGTADKVREMGFEKVHEVIDPAALPAVTDAVYKEVTPAARGFLTTFVPAVFPGEGDYYYERSPNVRFHIPFDRAQAQRKEFDKFAKKVGEGKLSAHGPHRDPWVDCPENVINVWIAIGPVKHGNGLTVFAKDYDRKLAFKNGYLTSGSLNKPLSFEMQPGDVVLFHSNHLHGSELNRTDETRYVVSYRVAFGKPYYPHGHYHHYQHGGLAAGPLHFLAGVPQNLQWSFFRYQFARLRYKLTGQGRMSGRDSDAVEAAPITEPTEGSVALADLPVGTIRAVSKKVCIARLGENEFAALSRYCPHAGGDLTGGWIDDGKVVCPMHSMEFDTKSGASPCKTLAPLRRYQYSVRDGRVYVDADEAKAG